jgi:serine/threonine-protein kinase
MSYCLNPACSQPQNSVQSDHCQACGNSLKLRNRYRVLSGLGQGGFGATFLAVDEALPGQPKCVIKQLRPNTTDPTVIQMARELFEREAKTLGKIGNHPQIPRLLDYFADTHSFYLVQEYISGATLQQEVKRNGPFTEVGVKQFLSEILPLLGFVHSQKVIHRDMKPANIIRRHQDGKLVLIDFGAVKDQVTQSMVTGGGQTAFTSFAIGTAGFAPPEQMAMRPVYASDIYALGVTCLYLLTGKSPKDLDYDSTTGEMCWRKSVQASDRLVKLLQKMLEVSVRHRYQTADEVLQALDMEPYLDSLANSMIAKPLNNRPIPPPEESLASDSPASRAAKSIRARRNKDQTSLEGGMLRHQLSSSDSSGTRLQGSRANLAKDSSVKSSAKRDASDILNAYAKGRRDFTAQDLSTLNLQRVDLSGAIFHEANLGSTNLQGATLFNVNFGRANLNYASLRNARLAKAYFSHADLQGADLRGADLSNAYLNSANLRGANLCGANLTGAKVTEEQLALAKTNWTTIKPGGKRTLW